MMYLGIWNFSCLNLFLPLTGMSDLKSDDLLDSCRLSCVSHPDFLKHGVSQKDS